MEYYGIRKLLAWFKNFLSGRTQQIVVEGIKSRTLKVISGIFQGSVVSALCFLIFINDLPESITNSFSGIFCDDTLVAREIKSPEDHEQLQNDLKRIKEWTMNWGMDFNVTKCDVISITNKRQINTENYYLNGTELKRKRTIKYLGVTIDNKLTFKDHIQNKIKKANTVLNMIRRNLYFAPRSVKNKAYLATVRPILEYASMCWSPYSANLIKKIEMVQHSAAKFVMNSYPKKGHYNEFSVSKLLDELGWDTLEKRREESQLTMAFKIINNLVILNPETLPKKIHPRQQRKCNQVLIDNKHQLVEPDSRLDVSKNTFFSKVPSLWNRTVTQEQAEAPNVESFKRYFRKPSKN